jgi:2-C-methyl-D-erythritol 4-phosphate cytidylyltransferase
MSLAVLIPAAGRGERLGAAGPNALVQLAGRPLIGWCLEAFAGAEAVGEIVVAGPRDDLDDLREVAIRYAPDKPCRVVVGGDTRSASVRNALAACSACEWIAIHDAARPLVTAELLSGALSLLRNDSAAGVVCATQVTDTIKLADHESRVVETLDRSRLWSVQTPQVFRRQALTKALTGCDERELAAATDDAHLVQAAGGRIGVHPAPAENLKVTTDVDHSLAEMLLGRRVHSNA